MRKTIVKLFTLCFVMLSCFNLYALDLFQPRYENQAAQEFTLKDLSDKDVSLSDFSGRSVILFFWTTWCPYCRKELAVLNEQYKDMVASNIELLAIDVSESKARIESFIKKYSIQFPILLDTDGSVSYKYGVMGVPTIVLISKQGKIASVSNDLPSNYKELLSE